MTDAKSTFGHSSADLARLLELGARPTEDASPDAARAERLSLALAGPLPEATAADGGGRLPAPGMQVGHLLLDPTTGLGVLERIKAHWKRRTHEAEEEMDRAVAVTLYFAAIASALRFHDARISSQAPATLAAGLESLARKKWMPPELSDHLAAARRLLPT